MKKRVAISIVLLLVLALLAFAVYRGQSSRELILQRNGLPSANLKGNFIPMGVAGSPLIPTSTDSSGKLDLSGVPTGCKQISITLSNGSSNVHNSLIELPTSGSRTIDIRGNRTICTTIITYADFGFFKLSNTEVMDWTEK
jgi:hypothetical protein